LSVNQGIDTVKINQTKAEAGDVFKDDGNTVSIGTENAIRNVEFIEFSDVRLAVDTLAITPIVSFVDKAISVSEGDNGSTLVTLLYQLLNYWAIMQLNFLLIIRKMT
jgi:hypothetical protein